MPESIATERDAHPSPGGCFYRDGDVLMFRFVIDPGNIIGPRPATRADSEKHVEAWADFLRSEERSPLDRDAMDGPGGSLPTDAEQPAVSLVEEKDMTGFAERLEPAPEKPKRAAKPRKVQAR